VPPLVQRDDKIVGVAIAGLERLNSDGSPDTGFTPHVNGVGWYGNFSATTKLAQQADGKILAAGNAAPPSALLRFNTDGSLDLMFGQAGVALVPPGDSIVGLTTQSDGKIVLAAESQVSIGTRNTTAFTLLRYNRTEHRMRHLAAMAECRRSASWVQTRNTIRRRHIAALGPIDRLRRRGLVVAGISSSSDLAYSSVSHLAAS
jgi:uncharacterized delta-60 repeat protein